jgi:hypothetical protein
MRDWGLGLETYPQLQSLVGRLGVHQTALPGICRQSLHDVLIYGLQAATLPNFLLPPSHMVTMCIVGFPFGSVAPPSAWAFAPTMTNPLRWYPKATETVHAVTEVWRVDYVIVGWPVALWFPATV